MRLLRTLNCQVSFEWLEHHVPIQRDEDDDFSFERVGFVKVL